MSIFSRFRREPEVQAIEDRWDEAARVRRGAITAVIRAQGDLMWAAETFEELSADLKGDGESLLHQSGVALALSADASTEAQIVDIALDTIFTSITDPTD